MKKYLITLTDNNNKISSLKEVTDNFNLNLLKEHPKFELLHVIEQEDLSKLEFGNQFYYLDKESNTIKIETTKNTETYLKEQELKQNIKNIDKQVQDKILEGFTFKDNLFSLSQNAQINWQGLFCLYNSNMFGESQIISTRDNKTFMLKKEDLLEFILTGKQAILDAMQYGYNEKEKLV